MPHALTSLLVHVAFSTKDRAPVLSPEFSERLFPYMGGILRELKGAPLIINGAADHVHLLVSISAATALAEVMRVLKTNSSRWVHEQYPERKRFAWQTGYAAFTVSVSRASDVSKYIASQQEHHRRISFAEEFLLLLEKHGLEYDPERVWG